MTGNLLTVHWPEVMFVLVLFLGLFIALITPSVAVSYLTAIVGGFLIGRLIIASKKGSFKFTYYLVAIGFLAGFLIGEIHASKKVIVILFLAGSVISYFVYSKRYVKDVNY